MFTLSAEGSHVCMEIGNRLVRLSGRILPAMSADIAQCHPRRIVGYVRDLQAWRNGQIDCATHKFIVSDRGTSRADMWAV